MTHDDIKQKSQYNIVGCLKKTRWNIHDNNSTNKKRTNRAVLNIVSVIYQHSGNTNLKWTVIKSKKHITVPESTPKKYSKT